MVKIGAREGEEMACGATAIATGNADGACCRCWSDLEWSLIAPAET